MLAKEVEEGSEVTAVSPGIVAEFESVPDFGVVAGKGVSFKAVSVKLASA